MNAHTWEFIRTDLFKAFWRLCESMKSATGADEDVIEIERLLAEERRKDRLEVIGEIVDRLDNDDVGALPENQAGMSIAKLIVDLMRDEEEKS